MANPQKENGYIPIANEIAEALASIRIPGEVSQVLWVIFRKTYGFNKKEDHISLSQFSLLTKLKKPTVCRALNKAIKLNIIIKKDNGFIKTYRINKDFDTWRPLSKKITIIKKDNKSLSKKIHTKDNNTKDRNTDDKSSFLSPLSEELKKNAMIKAYSESEFPSDDIPSINIETGDYHVSVKPKKKSKNKIALSLLDFFGEKCLQNTGTQPMKDARGYFIILDAMNKGNLSEEQCRTKIEDWFASGKPVEELVQITRCFSHVAVNAWKVTTGIQ